MTTLIERKIKLIEGQKTIKVGEINYQFNEEFTLIILTKDKSVLKIPEFFIKCEILNFGIFREGIKERLIQIILEIQRGEDVRQELENKHLILERLNKLEENQDVVLKRLNKHNDHTLLEDHEFVNILESSKQENEEIKREIEDRKERKTRESSELGMLENLVK